MNVFFVGLTFTTGIALPCKKKVENKKAFKVIVFGHFCKQPLYKDFLLIPSFFSNSLLF